MIKPVYFGKSKEDKLLFDYANKMSNFSDWARNKLREELGLNQTEIVGIDKTEINNKENIKDIEILVKRIVMEIIRGEEKVEIEEEIKNVEIIEAENDIKLGGWTL